MENIGIILMKAQAEAGSWLEILKLIGGGIVGALIGLVPFFVQIFKSKSEKPVTDSTAAEKIVTAAGELQKSYQALVRDLNTQLEDLRNENTKLRDKVDRLYLIVKVLIKQLKEADITPEIDIDMED